MLIVHSAKNKFQDWPWKSSVKQDFWIQRFNTDLNAFSSSFCGIISSARVVAVLMVEMSLKSILSTLISILGIERNRTGQNHVNTMDDSTHRLDFEPKIDEQWVRRDSVHYRATETRSLYYDIQIEYDRFRPSDALLKLAFFYHYHLLTFLCLSKNVYATEKIFAPLKQSSPYTWCIYQNASDALLTSFAWNLITDLCSMLVFQHWQYSCFEKTVITLLFINRLKQNWYYRKEECRSFQTPF